MVAVAVNAPSARPDGLGTLFVTGATLPVFHAALLSSLGGGFLLCGVAGVGAVVAAVSFAALLRYHLCRRIGGVTGDVIGAAGEISQLLALLIIGTVR
jgi:adenosylcobinamide-GDP ribazoletransferase